ncbi:MAG: ABC transporter ATP-binding protein [Bacteroidales bacterium]|nr:ABC transporter ATP-binding protein [Bacteroidales bacterium]
MLEVRNISKKYKKGSDEFTALNGVSLSIGKGEFAVITGASGSGKSTLLYTVGGLIRPDSGEVLFDGTGIYDQKPEFLNQYRKRDVGFMFQQFHLMPYLTVYENIRLTCYARQHLDRIDYYLEKCSLNGMKRKYPSELSVGEKQRTAFIRAIVADPVLLLADEPTGNLDPENSNILMLMIEEYNRNGGTVLLVSHDPGLSANTGRRIILQSGKVVGSSVTP